MSNVAKTKKDMFVGLYCYATIVRDTATWSKVKAASDGLKHRCEMFDATANGLCNATETEETKLITATNCSPRIFNFGQVTNVEYDQASENMVGDLQVIKGQYIHFFFISSFL